MKLKLKQTIATSLFLIGLSYLTMTILENFIFKDIRNILYPDFNYKLFYTLLFGLLVSASLINNKDIKSKGLIFIVLFVIAGFCIEALIVFSASKPHNFPNIINTISLNFKTLFYLPVYPFILLLWIRIFRILKLNIFLYKLSFLKKNINLSRFFALLIDLFVVYIIGLILNNFFLILWFPVEILLLLFGYRFIFETAYSTTIGKSIFGVILIRADNTTPTIRDIFIRNISRITVLYWIPMLTGKKGWHEKLSKTLTIKNEH